jgi:hypothetical protein
MTRAIVCVVLLAACTKKTEPAPQPAPIVEPPKPEPMVVLKEEPAPAPPPRVEIDAGPQQALVVIDSPPPPPQVEEPPRYGGQDEQTWRKRFREAHALVDGFEERLEDAKAAVAKGEYELNRYLAMNKRPGPMPPGYEDAKRFVDGADDERKAVNSALEDLEREAANAGVPLEWRR